MEEEKEEEEEEEEEKMRLVIDDEKEDASVAENWIVEVIITMHRLDAFEHFERSNICRKDVCQCRTCRLKIV